LRAPGFIWATRLLRVKEQEDLYMGWIVAIIVGGIAGWLASMVMARDASMGIFWNIVVGIIGAIIGNAVIAPLIGIGGSIQTFNLGGFIVAIIGAIVLVAIVNLVQRGRVRLSRHNETKKGRVRDHAGPPFSVTTIYYSSVPRRF
jgi:uncharacterized membrane protein YeaQ/YmgE (transglycosylase-associated protein family)